MQTRLFSLTIGLFYLVVGILAFIPALYTTPPVGSPHVDVTGSYGMFLGTFPTNVVHDALNIVIGVFGIAFGARVSTARAYSELLFFVFGFATIFGFIPSLDTLWGVAPLWSPDTWVHAISAGAASYFAYVALAPTNVEPAAPASAH